MSNLSSTADIAVSRKSGFTLLEILIALFIFTILSLILGTALRNVINVQFATEKKAERLSDLQMALLMMSRDIEQTVNRSVMSATAQEEPALQGDMQGFNFTHTGFANPLGTLNRSVLSRTAYHWSGDILTRTTWAVLDLAPDTQSHSRALLSHVLNARFDYLDQEGHFHSQWPLEEGQSQQALPKAIKLELTLAQWGKISQIYVISAQNSKQPPPPPKS